MAILSFSHQNFLVVVQRLAGRTTDKVNTKSIATQEDNVKDFAYASPKTFAQIFGDIQDPLLGEKCIKNPNPHDLIWALHFLKKYPTAKDLANRQDGCPKRSLERAWKYVEAIQALKERKIKWIFDDPKYADEYFWISVDGVHCRITEPRCQPSSGWYSKKFNKAGLTYELAVAIYSDKIVWVNGPFPAGQNDMRVFCKPGGLKSKLQKGHPAVTDEGYRGAPDYATTRNAYDSEEVKYFKGRAKARHETVNSRLKAFGILNQPFRTNGGKNGRLERHKAAFEACLVIIQYELDNGSKLMRV